MLLLKPELLARNQWDPELFVEESRRAGLCEPTLHDFWNVLVVVRYKMTHRKGRVPSRACNEPLLHASTCESVLLLLRNVLQKKYRTNKSEN